MFLYVWSFVASFSYNYCPPKNKQLEVTAIYLSLAKYVQWGKSPIVNVLWYGVGGQLMIQALPLSLPSL